MKDTLDKINLWIDISEKEISGLEELATETTKIKHTEKKEIF